MSEQVITFEQRTALDKNKREYTYLALIFRTREVGRVYLSNEIQTIIRELTELSAELSTNKVSK